MRILRYVAPGALLLGLAAGLVAVRAADEAPKYTIKQVMDMAHKGKDSIYNKITKTNTATDDDKKKLVELYTALAADHPKMADDKDWTDRTTALLAAAKDVEAGKDGSVDELKKAATCGDCHDLHKPEKK